MRENNSDMGRSFDETGDERADLANTSAISLLVIPACPGIHKKLILMGKRELIKKMIDKAKDEFTREGMEEMD